MYPVWFGPCHSCKSDRSVRPDYICLFWSSLLPCRRCRLPRTNKATTSENLNCRDFSIHNGVPARNMRLRLQSETGKPTFCIQAPKLTIGTRSPPAFFFQTTQQHSITHTTIFNILEHREDRKSPSISIELHSFSVRSCSFHLFLLFAATPLQQVLPLTLDIRLDFPNITFSALVNQYPPAHHLFLGQRITGPLSSSQNTKLDKQVSHYSPVLFCNTLLVPWSQVRASRGLIQELSQLESGS